MSSITAIIDNIPEADYPPALADAVAYVQAIDALAKQVAGEPPVDLTTATTPANAPKILDAAVAYDVGHDVKVRHIDALARIAGERLGAAQQLAATAHETRFAKQFDKAAQQLADNLKERGPIDPTLTRGGAWPFDPQWASLRAILADLERLGNVRDNYATRAGGGAPANPPVSNMYERHSRTAILADANVSIRLEQATGSYPWHGDAYWLAAAQTPGVRLCWQDAHAQAAQPAPAAIAAERASMAALRAVRA